MSLSNLVGQVLDEKYRIEKQLGKGGMGAVYLATHLGTDRPVAVKVIVPQFMLNDEFVERFKREAKAAGRMRHPNVVDVTDFGFASVGGNRVAYLVMEYLDGCSLADVLAEESRLPIDWIVDILEQTCSAVDEAHRAGTIHRDLKPDNIWLEPNRRGGYTVKVLDFGLAKHGESASIADPTPIASNASSSILASCRLTQATTKATALTHKTELLEGATRTMSHDGSEAVTMSEAATMIEAPSVAEHEETLILEQRPPAPEPEESATQLLPPEDSESETLALPVEKRTTNEIDHNTAQEQRAMVTASGEGLTRVGSILGTPLYMSPEQCRGEPLDARSDIYSLGVIAYQMLTGEPPFKGDLHEVMRQHMEAPPPPLREKRKKIPKRMASIVMSALAKNLDERPRSAATFASAFRASSEGTGKLLRRAFSLYSEHFPLFFRLGFMAYLPVFFIIGLYLLREALPSLIASKVILTIITVLLSVSLVFANFLASVVITGVTIWFVVQLYAAPLRPLRLRSALRSLKKRLKPFALTTLRVVFFTCLLLPLLIVPGVIYFINSSLTAPVVIIENLKGRAAVRRSKALVKHARLTVIAILILEWTIPALVSSIVLSAFGIKSRAHGGVSFSFRFGEWIGTSINVIFIPLVAMLTALLYLKVRQLSGERLKDMLDQFEQEEAPRSNWQKRMRERLSASSHSTRSA